MNLINKFKKLYEIHVKKARQIDELHEDRAKSAGVVLKAVSIFEKHRQGKCTHRKGGVAKNTTVAEISKALQTGDSNNFSVIKHLLTNGDWWIRCLRCGKTWLKPIRAKYVNELDYQVALSEYNMAVNFQTNNQPSSSVQCVQTNGDSEFSVRYRKCLNP